MPCFYQFFIQSEVDLARSNPLETFSRASATCICFGFLIGSSKPCLMCVWSDVTQLKLFELRLTISTSCFYSDVLTARSNLMIYINLFFYFSMVHCTRFWRNILFLRCRKNPFVFVCFCFVLLLYYSVSFNHNSSTKNSNNFNTFQLHFKK